MKPELASNNASLESDLIEKKKAEIKKKQEEEQAQIKAIEEAQAQARIKLRPWLLPMLQNALKAILLKCSSKEINHHAHLRRWSGRWRAVCSWRTQAQSQNRRAVVRKYVFFREGAAATRSPGPHGSDGHESRRCPAAHACWPK
ncbi:hypothetical protein [Xylella fastidiosa]|uniref:hypothetical protein n=1 Tax=Xylella fastidiosa TaxID=2371 RepID=UPI00241EFE3A|nr:hypothetical protein [Xylella fastidiosa]